MTIKNIFLDFYNNNLICFNAKQNDVDRYVKITCTDYGKKYTLDKERMSAVIAYKRDDEREDLVNGVIQNDGTILLQLTEDMLKVSGKLELEVIIIATHAFDVNGFVSSGSFKDSCTNLISTM